MTISNSGLLSAAKSSSMMKSERRERRVCKQGRLVPICYFCSVSFRPCAKMLVGNFPNPFQTASAGCRLRVPAERFHPIETKKHAKGRRKIDLWRVSFTGSAAGPAAVSHLRRIARYFSVPAKAAASPPWPCGIPGRLPSSA